MNTCDKRIVMKSRERFNLLCAKSLANRLSPEEEQEFQDLLTAEPERRQVLDELQTVSPLLKEFTPLMDAMEDAPPANFPEHRMGQFKSAVWEEFRDRVPQRSKPNVFAWLWDRAMPISAAAAAGIVVVGLVLAPPDNPQPGTELTQAGVTAPGQDTRRVEFGVYNPVGYGDYTVQALVDRLNIRAEDALGKVDELNAVAEPLIFEMADAFEQWKGDSMDSTTYARVWLDRDLDTLHIVTRQGERLEKTSRNLPEDDEKRQAVIEQTLQDLSNGEGDSKQKTT